MAWLSDDERGMADAPLADWEVWWWRTCAASAFVFLVVVGIVAALK